MKHYILLDRSGSMSSRWPEACAALNEYAKGISESDTVILRTFDSHATYDNSDINLANRFGNCIETVSQTSAKDFPGIPSHVQPRGMTPLFDAVGKTLTEMVKERSVLIVITDGAENMSKEFTHNDVRKLIDAYKEPGIEVIFIGADFSNMSDAAAMGVDLNNRSFTMTAGNYVGAMRTMAANTTEYASTGVRSALDITPEMRSKAGS